MDEKLLQQVLHERISAGLFTTLSGEEYFFLLAQVLVAILARLGGVDKYRREFNYLTNPSVRKTAGELGLRVLHFLAGIRDRLILDNQLGQACEELLKPEYCYAKQEGNLRQWEEAFYEGLYSDNLFVE